MSWPIYFKDRLTVSNPNSGVAIATLWTPKETLEKILNPDDFYIAGQLYTKKGINYVIRNILANPVITKLYLVGSDLMGSGEAFLRFMQNGVDDDYKVIGDDIAKIEKEISREAIEAFRKNVDVVDMIGVEKLNDILIKRATPIKWRSPEVFPDPTKSDVQTFPSEVDCMKVRRPTIAEAYISILKHISMFGLESEAVINYVSDTSKTMKEMLNLTAVVTDEDPDNWNIPDYLPFSKGDLEKYFKGFFDPDPHTEDYTYGERLFNFAHSEMSDLKEIYPWLKLERFDQFFTHGGFDQVAISIVRKLKGFKYDKGAIALLANPFTDVFPKRPSSKTPCLFLIQCQIYESKLTLTAYFRSNDMYNAWPLNAFALRKLQSNIANELTVEMGALITISNMAHIYEHNYQDAKELYEKNDKGYCEWDPRGNLSVMVENSDIVARWMTPRGNEEIKEWRIDGKKRNAARLISFEIENGLAISTLGNALYIGRQLERAETAIKLGLKFTQDNHLEFDTIKTWKTKKKTN